MGSINHLFGKKAILADFEQTIDFASKNLYSNKGDGEKITLYTAQDDFNESRYIAKKIENYKLEIKNDGLSKINEEHEGKWGMGMCIDGRIGIKSLKTIKKQKRFLM